MDRASRMGISTMPQRQMTKVANFRDAEGLAALGICESLILALTKLKIITEQCNTRCHRDRQLTSATGDQ